MKNLAESANILDCTLRDGGYYNNWNFSREFINSYLRLLNRQRIEYCEIGFRTTGNNPSLGVCAFTPNYFLEDLDIPENLRIGVMINAKEFHDLDSESFARLFSRQANTKLSFVRIAAVSEELAKSWRVIANLKSLGYQVFVNVMQAHDLSVKVLDQIIHSLDQETDVIYLADTLGKFTPQECESIFQMVSESWKGGLGLHAHDNKGLALANSISAISSGANWIDSTIMGMGRGPGNTKTEELIGLREGQDIQPNSAIDLWDFNLQHMQPLHREYGWGANPIYRMAAEKEIHPSYVQSILASQNSISENAIQALQSLSKLNSSRFDPNLLADANSIEYKSEVLGNFPSASTLKTNEVLIFANTAYDENLASAIRKYSKSRNCKVISINAPLDCFSNIADYIAIIHPTRLNNIDSLNNDERKKLVMPMNYVQRFSPNTYFVDSSEILSYEVSISPQNFDVRENSCVLPQPLGLLYALSLAISMGASKVSLVGFSGVGMSDQERDTAKFELNLAMRKFPTVEVRSLAKTFLDVPANSIYKELIE